MHDVIPLRHPLHQTIMQYRTSYRTDYPTETALHSTVLAVEKQLERNGYVVDTFLDRCI